MKQILRTRFLPQKAAPQRTFFCGAAAPQFRAKGRLQGKVALCVVEADALDDLLQCLFVQRILAVLHPLADHVAQNAAEVVVAGVAQELRLSVSMPTKLPSRPRFARLLIWFSMPIFWSLNHQSRTVLDLAGDLIGLEATQDGADLLIICRVQAVDDGLRALNRYRSVR